MPKQHLEAGWAGECLVMSTSDSDGFVDPIDLKVEAKSQRKSAGRLLHLVTLLRFADLIGKFFNRPKVGGSRTVRVVPSLFPVLQGLKRDSVSARKYGLAHAKSFPDRFCIGKLNDSRAAFVGRPLAHPYQAFRLDTRIDSWPCKAARE